MYTVVGFQPCSSPLAVRSTPNGGGNATQKRSVSARGAVSTSLPRPLSSSTASLLSAAEANNVVSAEQLYKHFSLSASVRRNVSSSPTESGFKDSSATKPAVSSAVPTAITVGFSVQSSAFSNTSSTASSAPAGSGSSFVGCRQTSLLSKALTTEVAAPDEALHTLPEVSALLMQRQGSYFPDVDTTLLSDLQERHAVFHTELVSTAFLLAARAHAGQMRKDGTSQLSHCVMTALQLADMALDEETVAAGLLHEVLRVNPMLRSQMEEFMPSRVIQMVDRVTTISEISQLYRNNRDALGEEKMRRMLLAMEDVRAMLIKLACRVHDMKTLSALPRDKQLCLAQETLDIFSVVANRLGIWSLKAELEDLAFSVLYPHEADALRAQVAKRQDPETLEATINAIKAALDERGVQYEDISGRPKNLYGIWTKMRASGITDLDQVYDVTALRVVVANKHDCYVALRCVQELYRTMPSRSKDYIKENKKPNGYQSLHETIYGEGSMPVEVQIRTHKMHYIAEYGFAAHWKYKEKLSNEDEWLDKEVQYKKWLTTYKLGLNDKKVRASGAPPRDTALKSLGMHLIDASAPRSSIDAQPGVDPFLKHDRFRLQAPVKRHVNVVVQTQDGIDTREFPMGTNASQLSVDLGVEALPGYTMTVNQRLPAPDAVLQSGDLIQVVPMEQALSRSPPQTQPAGSSSSRGSSSQQQQSRLVLLPGSSVPVRVPLSASTSPALEPELLCATAPASMPAGNSSNHVSSREECWNQSLTAGGISSWPISVGFNKPPLSAPPAAGSTRTVRRRSVVLA